MRVEAVTDVGRLRRMWSAWSITVAGACRGGSGHDSVSVMKLRYELLSHGKHQPQGGHEAEGEANGTAGG